MQLNEAINKIASTTKRKEKEQYLEEIKQSGLNDLFKKTAFLALDPRHDFYTVEFETDDSLCRPERTIEEVLDTLKAEFLDTEFRGNKASERLSELYHSLSVEDAKIFRNVIDRTLRCGVSSTTINKVWGDFIYIHPYMRGSSYNEKNIANIKLPAYSQLKEDGRYSDIIVEHDGELTYMSRQGQINESFKGDKDQELITHGRGYVFMGEALVMDENGDIMPREEGNGILNSSEEKIDPERIVFKLWDCVPIDEWRQKKCSLTYDERFEKLNQIVSLIENKNFQVVETRIVETPEELVAHFKENIKKGLEGTMIKNRDMKWKNGTSKDMVKIKIIFDIELEVIDYYEGQRGTKYEGKLGGLVCKSSCGMLKVDIGSGLTDKEREDWFGDHIIGSIMTARANDISKENDEGICSLINPRIVEKRDDKAEADSLERIFEQKEASINALNVLS